MERDITQKSEMEEVDCARVEIYNASTSTLYLSCKEAIRTRLSFTDVSIKRMRVDRLHL